MRTSRLFFGLCLCVQLLPAAAFSEQNEGRFQKTLASAKAGDQDSQYRLAKMFESGLAPRQDYLAAADWYRKAAKQGHVKARFKLGYMNHLGIGIPQDYYEAVKWYRLAAQSGNKYAQNNFGDLLQNGQGIPRDLKEAEMWFSRAAVQGFAFAFYSLGGLYEKEHGDLVEAYKWYLLAANHGVEEATDRIGRLGPRIGAEGIADARARARIHRFPPSAPSVRKGPAARAARDFPSFASARLSSSKSRENVPPGPAANSLLPLIVLFVLLYCAAYGLVVRKRGQLFSLIRVKTAAAAGSASTRRARSKSPSKSVPQGRPFRQGSIASAITCIIEYWRLPWGGQSSLSAADEVRALFLGYRRIGGELSRFSTRELCGVAAILNIEELDRDFDGLGVERALETAKLLAKEGEKHIALKLISDDVLAKGPIDEVVAFYDEAGELGHLLMDRSSGRGPGFLSRLAAALTKRNKFKEALIILESKPREHLTGDDACRIIELLFLLKQFDRAEKSLKEYKRSFSVESDPERHYSLAKQFESVDRAKTAALVYQLFVEQSVPFRDAALRCQQLFGVFGTPPKVQEPGRDSLRGELCNGRYSLGSQIGQGGIGIVYRGKDFLRGCHVAIKSLRPELKGSQGMRQRFIHGARIVAQLHHKNIGGIEDIVEEGGEIYLVMEFIDGKTVAEYLLERKTFSFQEGRDIIVQACEAVEFAHSHHVLHRDLKPSNIMMDSRNSVKVMDFDLARQVKDAIGRMTQIGVAGTPAYMAPEQHLGDPRPASDVYSLGVSLYEMLTGELPFSSGDYLSQKERMAFRPAREIVPQLPQGIDEVLARALAPLPADRIMPRGLVDALKKI